MSPIWLSTVPSLMALARWPTIYHPLRLKISPRNQGRSIVAMKYSSVTEAELEWSWWLVQLNWFAWLAKALDASAWLPLTEAL